MFACLHAPSVSASRLVTIAASFTPRFEVVGPLVMLDVSGLSRLFGGADEIGAHLDRALNGAEPAGTAGERPYAIAVAPTQTAAALLALDQSGLTVVAPGGEAGRLASLPVLLLADLECIAGKHQADLALAAEARSPKAEARSAKAEPLFRKPPRGVGAVGWGPGGHPRSTHQASQTRRMRRAVARERESTLALRKVANEAQMCVEVLHRWGIHTLGALAALPPPDVSSRLSPRGPRWQRMAVGEDDRPLVPWIADDPFEATLDLEWPIEGLEPLSFVLARLFEPLVARLERADRGAAVIQTTLRLVTRAIYARTLQLPAPMRDAKTFRALVLLDLESHPPPAAVDRVQVLIEPTRARGLQWELFARAQPSPEHVSTLLARLKALAGEGHVGSPRLLDSWKPGAFEMAEFHVIDTRSSAESRGASIAKGLSLSEADERPPLVGRVEERALSEADERPPLVGRVEGLRAALRRFRLPVPARVTVREGRPARVQSDRHGVPGGAVISAAGPWRTSGQWWDLDGAPAPCPERAGHSAGAAGESKGHGVRGPWDRDEWDVELSGGLVYRIFVEREIGQWFIEGLVD